MEQNWTEIIITVDTKDTEQAEAIANMTVPYGIYTEDYSNLETDVEEIAHINLIDEDLLKKDRTKSKIHIYINPQDNPAEAISFIEQQLKKEKVLFTTNKNSIQEEDWANTWKQYYKPMKIGKNLIVCPSWEEYKLKEDEVKLTLDPGMAFGTGSHETTSLCLEIMQNFNLKDKAVLDVGCGSGILGIGAALLGAKSATGCDIDSLAVKVATENAQINNVSDKCQFICSSLTDDIKGKFDIIFANIVADVVNILCVQIPQFMSKEGIFITSGIIDTRKDEVMENIKQAGFEILSIHEKRGWVAFAAKVQN